MGTSKSNSGPGKTPLLPDWYNPQPPLPDKDEENENTDTVPDDDKKDDVIKPSNDQIESWRSAKTNLTSYIKNKTPANLKRSARSYVKNYGGAKKASSTAIIGKSTAATFIGFINNLSANGINSAAESFGVKSFDGLDVKGLFALLANEIAPDGDTPEAAVARAAVTETLCDIYKDIENEGGDISTLDSILKDKENEYVILYLSNYIFFRWVHELGETFEIKKISANQLINIENEMREFIKISLQEKWTKQNLKAVDFNTPSGKQIVDQVFEQAYLIIEDL